MTATTPETEARRARTPGPATTLDERRGHLVLDLPHRAGHHSSATSPSVVGCDMGGHLLNITASGAYLDPDDARELADALHWWADRQESAGWPR